MSDNFVIIIFGATRGIGRQCAISFAEFQNFKRDDSNVKLKTKIVVTGKSTKDTEKLPGTIYSVAEEVSAKGAESLPIQCDVRNEAEIDHVIETTLQKFGRIDVMFFNSGSILWNKVIDTPTRRFDLMNSINARGPYIATYKVLLHMLKQKYGRIILVSPPIYSRFFKGKTPYAMTKVAASVLTMGLANEIQNTGVSINSLWPATAVKSQVIINKGNYPDNVLREPTVFADACLEIIKDSSDTLNGKTLIDEDFLRTKGVTDFSKYRCDPAVEPPRMMPKKFPSLLVEEENEQLIAKL